MFGRDLGWLRVTGFDDEAEGSKDWVENGIERRSWTSEFEDDDSDELDLLRFGDMTRWPLGDDYGMVRSKTVTAYRDARDLINVPISNEGDARSNLRVQRSHEEMTVMKVRVLAFGFGFASDRKECPVDGRIKGQLKNGRRCRLILSASLSTWPHVVDRRRMG
jgi:hypothetical protein